MAWLMCDARVLASAEVLDDRRSKRRGLLGRDELDGALLLDGCRWVHTVGMRFAIDVAFLDKDGLVVRTVQMPRHRVGLPVFRAHQVIEAQAGAFARWGLHVGDVIEVRLSEYLPPPTLSAESRTAPPDAS